MSVTKYRLPSLKDKFRAQMEEAEKKAVLAEKAEKKTKKVEIKKKKKQ